MGGHTRYTFMDGYAGYNQIFVALQDIHKMALTTPWGTFVWVLMYSSIESSIRLIRIDVENLETSRWL